MMDEITKPKFEKMILRVDHEPPPQFKRMNQPTEERKEKVRDM